ncbi:unnamed protein product, partial [Owenia fusiformis]
VNPLASAYLSCNTETGTISDFSSNLCSVPASEQSSSYVLITIGGSGTLVLCEVEVVVRKDGVTALSSGPNSFRAIDGDFTQLAGDGALCSETSVQVNPFWITTLDDYFRVERVDLYQRVA